METHALRPKDIINLASPSSWTASVMPSILAIGLAYKSSQKLDAVMAICLFLIAILMQSSVNALNDYMDFIKGNDTIENSPVASDAVVVYGLAPKTARNVGICFLVMSFIPGVYCVYKCGAVPLIIGIIGALVTVGYSCGKFPISYLPIGELVCGFVMGGLISLAGFYLQTKELDLTVLLWAIPVIIGIWLGMFINNVCDMERDALAGRNTLACVLGRKTSEKLNRILLIIWLVSPVILFLFVQDFRAVLVYVLECPVMLFGFTRQFSFKLEQDQKGIAMEGISNLNIILHFAYVVAILMG